MSTQPMTPGQFNDEIQYARSEGFNEGYRKALDIERLKRAKEMSTNDVPGAKAANRDQLAMGCWAEHEDESLIFVESLENGRVIYSMFDARSEPVTEYRHAMSEQDFKESFSWRPEEDDSEMWVWHDKTPFPWDRVIKAGARDGVRHASASDQMSAAERVAASLKLRGAKISSEKYKHMVGRARAGAGDILTNIGRKFQDWGERL